MRPIFTAAAAALLSLALSGCETTGTSNETTGSISSGDIKSSSLSLGYTTRPYGKLISSYAKTHGVPESLAHAVISVESNYRANARGAAGEIGLMQIKPTTARMMGYRGSAKGLYDPDTNIKYGMKYLAMAHKLGGGSTCGTILKYNAGHAAKRMNPVSKRYCGKVSALMK
ncbi:murein transglycosylase [Hoeflea sp. BAL378]|uniref:lytic transglycosylase domain-containing protein n=1 Tax=Hoeflea sp. BAL378 TaxID=1547437 RepID=UPI0005142835|nr:lytic transglycosylase domain-containing protein [Hoeflea sp. BAL378]KGF70166.1 murein transglycosylase [Hoeflea sp. BAL378]